MRRQAAILLGVPVALVAVFAVPLGLWRGKYQWLCAGVALALVVTPGLATLILADRLGKASPYGRVTAVFAGTFVRLVVGFGGAVVVFVLSRPTFHADPLSFWAWILVVYLITLTVETALLARMKSGV